MVRCKNDITPLHVYTKCLHYNDLQNTMQKAKDRATRTPLNTGDELRCSGRVGISSSTSGTHLFTPVTNSMISHG